MVFGICYLNFTSMINALKFLAFLLLFASCSASKKAKKDQNANALKPQTAEYLLEKMSAQHFDADWINAKAKIHFESEVQNESFNVTIRMKSDSLIWMNVKKLSVEGARILIDKDSVYVLNRLDKEYYVRGLDFVEQEYNLPADFKALQTMILGNPYLLIGQTYTTTTQQEQYRLSSKEGSEMLNDYWLNGLSLMVEQMSFLDLRYNRKLVVGLADYRPIEDQTFAFQRNYQMTSEQTGEINVKIKFSKLERNIPKSMPFSVSSRYKRVD